MAEHSAYIAYVRRPRRMEVLNGRVYSTSRAPAGLQRGGAALRTKKKTFKLWADNPDVKRRHRVAKYKLYAVEGRLKSSFKKGIRWIKRKCSRIVRGY